MAVPSPYAPGGRYGTNTTRYPISVRRPPPRTSASSPGLPGSPGWGAEWGWTGSDDPNVVTRATQNQYGSPYPGGGGGPGGRWITPDYSGILGSFTADARARFGAGLQAMEAQRLSGAKGAINRLGVRDVGSLLEKVKQYGLTQADLQGAADNPWSELKALDMQKRGAWNNTVAQLASQGGFRSGGSIGARGRIDQDAARNEALLTQNALEELSQGMFQKSNWEREQRDQMEQAIAQQQASLAAAYQPYWQQD